jgi:hypothetical protein
LRLREHLHPKSHTFATICITRRHATILDLVDEERFDR